MKTYKPAIVVAAFNRAASLQRILKSIENAKYPTTNIPLVISIDKSDKPEVTRIANDFDWKFGEKVVIEHSENLGLRKHILKCGDLTDQYGSIILLEDDLYVSPHYYLYTQEALSFYGDEERIAGISLYSHHYNETAFMRFNPISDEHNVYFMQIPSSWGQVWTKNQWADFRNWYHQNFSKKITSTTEVPPNVLLWPETSWKKYYFKYIIERDLYFVYPYISLSTNFADIGTHHTDNRTSLQEPLQNYEIQYHFIPFENAPVVYDSYCELTERSFKILCPGLATYNFDTDLYGQKDLQRMKKKFLLTSKKVSGKPVVSFGRQLKPHEMNIAFDNLGSTFHLIENKSAVSESFEMIDPNRNSFYYDIPEHFLLKSKPLIRTDDQIEFEVRVVKEYYEYCAIKKQRIFQCLRPIIDLELKMKRLLFHKKNP